MKDGTTWTVVTFSSRITIRVGIAAEMLKIGIVLPSDTTMGFLGIFTVDVY